MVIIWLGYTLAMLVTKWLPDNHSFLGAWDAHKIPYIIFYVVLTVMAGFSVAKRWSLIPVLGVVSNLYLIAGLGIWNWVGFTLWCVFGLAIYFGYGYWNSRLTRTNGKTAAA